MRSKEGKREIVVFLIEFIVIGCFLCECVCELNEISMKMNKGTRVSLRPCFSANYASKGEDF
jgi:formate hydrogenlyase subunit 6/NADH:ubiquinone oxidoreductase subunit I